MNTKIRQAKREDIEKIIQIANQWLLTSQKDPERDGFLISNFTEKEYMEYLQYANYFWVAETKGEIDAFLLAYEKNKINPNETTNSLLKNYVNEDFVLIKQICANKESGFKGAAFKLYQRLFEEMPQDFALAAIVNEPLNKKSIIFHEKNNFNHFLNIQPPKDFDGKVRERSIWCFGKYKKLPKTRF